MYFILQGEVLNVETSRVVGKGSIIGQDDILFWRKRINTYRSVNTCYTMRLDRDTFDMMCKEFPNIKKELFEEANFRALIQRYSRDVHMAIHDNEAKKVIRKFNELSQE